MRDHPAWSFFNRSFLMAAAISVAWHLFWFFAVTIVVSPPKKATRTYPRIVSLGPVFDDTIMRTLTEARPELSEAFYRGPSTGLPEPVRETETIERGSPGDTVGLPSGNRFLSAMKMFFGSGKDSPELDWRPVGSRALDPAEYELSGALTVRSVISRPPSPPAPSSDLVLDLAVDEAGVVVEVGVARPSGDPARDADWAAFARDLRFASESGAGMTSGRLTVRAGGREA